jgi:prefoldin subunit 5
LRKISTAISSFTNRIENLEREHKDVAIIISKMEHRHTSNETSINNIQVSLARFEAKLDLLLKDK